MSELLNRSSFKKAILSAAHNAGKRKLGETGEYLGGINRIPETMYVEANRLLREMIERSVHVAHTTRKTIEPAYTKEQIAAMGLGPRRRKA